MRAYVVVGVLLVACSGSGAERPPQQPTPATTAVPDAAVPALVPIPTAVADEPDEMSDEEQQDRLDAMFEAYVDEVCACADMACYTDVSEEMAQRLAHAATEEEVREPSQRMLDLAAELTQCVTDLVNAERASP